MAEKFAIFYNEFFTKEGYKLVLDGLATTLILTFVGFLIGLVVGVLVAILRSKEEKNIFERILNALAKIYVGFFRGTPIVVQLLFLYFAILPLFGFHKSDALVVAVIIFGLNSGAYVSEIIRSGILSVDRGQNEAARALGLSGFSSLRFVVFPQAFKNSLPSLANEFIALLKETSVANYITVHDLTYAFKIIGSASYEFMVPYFFLALAYLALVLIATYIAYLIERRLRVSDSR